MTQDSDGDFSAFSGSDGKPTEAERLLIEATRKGAGAFCEELADEEKAVSAELIEAIATGTFSHANWKGWRQHPYGLYLRGAIVSDRLVLENRNIPIKLSFDQCEFRAGFDFDGASINGSLFLRRCRVVGGCSLVSMAIAGQFSADGAVFDNPGGVALNAQDVKSLGWFINRATFNGVMDINSAEIGGQVSANEARFEGEGVAVQAFGVKASSWFMSSAVVKGGFVFNGSHFDDGFYAGDTHFSNPGGDAIWAQRTKAGTLVLYGATVEGRFDLHEAEIGGQMNANTVKFLNPGGVAVWAQGVRVSSWFMCNAMVAGTFDINSALISGQFAASETTFGEADAAVFAYAAQVNSWYMDESVVKGRFDISSANIEGHFSAERAQFEHAELAFSANGARAASWSMTSAIVKGNFNLYAVNIEGYFAAPGATFENPGGCAFEACFARIGGGVFLRDGVTVIGDLDLSGATIGKALDLGESSFSAARYIAVRLQEVHVQGDTLFTSSTFKGIVDCTRAKFDGRLTVWDSVLIAPFIAVEEKLIPEQANDWGTALARKIVHGLRHHALLLKEARIGGRLVLSRIPARGIIDFSHACCNVLEDHAAAWPAPIDYKRRALPGRLYVTEDGTKTDIQHLVLDGFEYNYFEFPDGNSAEDQHSNKDVAEARVDWLAAQSADDLTERFNPQPWRQASAVLRAMGYDRSSQIISIERRVRERYARDMPKRQKFVSWLLHLVADYGFNPWKTVAISVGVVLLWAVFYWGGTALCGDPNLRGASGECGGQPLFVAVQHGDVDGRFVDSGGYPAFGHIAYSLDAFVPLFDFGTETYWRPNARAWANVTLDWPGLDQPPTLKIPLGYLLHWLFIMERFLGAILIAIAVTGFTGLLTRDEK
ncbi:hypothetical protein [Pelagibacterium sediminicola]|uniref:hypothetical protein n=1 Tax=Pelagibacterium sediminicola TaxID=2248761 RepID=UPI000E321C8F|nr:hypothetical protein [Pelagibacterium sediminicola]